MTVNHPIKEQHDDKLWVILLGGAFLVGLLAAVVYAVINLTTPDAPEPEVFAVEYCAGHTNGLAVSFYNAGAPAEIAIEYAQDLPALAAAFNVTEDSFACDLNLYAGDSPELAWCNGLAQGYIKASLVQGYGDPPADFIPRSIDECVTNGLAFTPPVPGTGVGMLGGGGGPVVND